MSRTSRRLLVTVVGALVASLSLTGCIASMIPTGLTYPAPTKAPDVTGVSDELLPYYGQTIVWENCDKIFDCATVAVPLDYSDVSAGDIQLAVVRHRADGGNPIGSLLTNPGGPGASGVSFIRDNLTYATGDALRQNFDVIGFDPRGVGASTAVACFDAAEMDSYLFDIPVNPRGSDAWTAEREAASRSFAEACEANSDGILPFITTENAARDMDVLRGALGDSELYYLGSSYGTFLGATYAKLFPERAGRLVLDGAIDPSVSGLDVGVTQGIGFEKSLRAYAASCLETSGCPFRGTVDEALSDIGTLLASVDRTPLTSEDGRRLGADSLLTAIITALYSQDNWPVLTEMLGDVLEGNADYAFYLADFYFNREDGTYLDNQTEAFSAYNCMDYPDDATQEQKDAAYATFRAQAPTIAEYWIGPDGCDQWVHKPTGVRERITAEGAAPIVVVGTTGDPATPYEWAVSLAEQLSSGVLVTYEGERHTAYGAGDACIDDAVEGFLVDGVVPDDGLVCG